jgi:hypothetical protein
VTRWPAGAVILKKTAFAAVVILPGSCSFWSDDDPCELVEEYQQARSASEVDVPPGLDEPESSTTLVIPDEPRPSEPLSENAACLQRPPDYFDKPLTGRPD